MKKTILLIGIIFCAIQLAIAQPPARRAEQQRVQRNNAQTLSTRAQLSFPTAPKMSEDVVWRRDIYREIDLTKDANAGLYYPVADGHADEPVLLHFQVDDDRQY